MTFEEAWAHIKEGKEFKVTWSDTKDTSEWITAKDISHVPLNIIGSSDFQIKCEPKEYIICGCCDKIWKPIITKCPNSNLGSTLTRVREVIE